MISFVPQKSVPPQVVKSYFVPLAWALLMADSAAWLLELADILRRCEAANIPHKVQAWIRIVRRLLNRAPPSRRSKKVEKGAALMTKYAWSSWIRIVRKLLVMQLVALHPRLFSWVHLCICTQWIHCELEARELRFRVGGIETRWIATLGATETR